MNDAAIDEMRVPAGDARPSAGGRSSLAAANPFVLLMGSGLWLLSHPYWGIWHDARIYTLMAARWLDPAPFVRDPWFMFGSQDAFSLFSPLYGSAVAAFGVNAAAKWGTLLSGVGYIGASWAFTRALPLARWRDLVFLLLVSVQLVYCVNDFGPFETLRVSEPFLTSRQFSISFALAALAAAIAGRRRSMAVLLLFSVLLHPLMGIWAVLAASSVLMPIRLHIQTGLITAGALSLVGLGMAGVGPFRPMSGDWELLVRNTAAIVFVAPDGDHRLNFAVLCYASLLAGIRWGSAGLRRWYSITLAMAFSVYVVNWFCSASFPATIVMQAQLWRANWLALVFAVVAAVDIAARARVADETVRQFAYAGGAVGLLLPWAGAVLFGLAACAPGRLHNAAYAAVRRCSEFTRRSLLAAFIAAAMIWVTNTALDIEVIGASMWHSGEAQGSWQDFFRGLFFTGGYGTVAFLVWRAVSFTLGRIAVAGLSLLTLVVGMWGWDSRPERSRLLDETLWGRPPSGYSRMFATHLSPGNTVYWQRHPERVWFELRTASYVSSTQAIGIVFSERMALEVARRLGRVALAGANAPIPATVGRTEAVKLRNADPAQLPVDLHNLHTYEAANLTFNGLRFICEDPELDFVIHDQLFPGHVQASESEIVDGRQILWNLYDCSVLRRHGGHTDAGLRSL
jgi:hypothetical protein